MPPAVALAATPDLSSAAETYLLRRAITRTITQPVWRTPPPPPRKKQAHLYQTLIAPAVMRAHHSGLTRCLM
jgi:hypothetical protein